MNNFFLICKANYDGESKDDEDDENDEENEANLAFRRTGNMRSKA